MYVYICTYIHVCVCLCVHIYIHTHTHTHVCKYMYIDIYIHACVYTGGCEEPVPGADGDVYPRCPQHGHPVRCLRGLEDAPPPAVVQSAVVTEVSRCPSAHYTHECAGVCRRSSSYCRSVILYMCCNVLYIFTTAHSSIYAGGCRRSSYCRSVICGNVLLEQRCRCSSVSQRVSLWHLGMLMGHLGYST